MYTYKNRIICFNDEQLSKADFPTEFTENCKIITMQSSILSLFF